VLNSCVTVFINENSVSSETFLQKKLKRGFEVDVYSLKAHSWRRLEDEWPCKDSSIWAGPVYLNI
jgi:hypothetical protein